MRAGELDQLITEASASSEGEVVTRALSGISSCHTSRDGGVDHFGQRA